MDLSPINSHSPSYSPPLDRQTGFPVDFSGQEPFHLNDHLETSAPIKQGAEYQGRKVIKSLSCTYHFLAGAALLIAAVALPIFTLSCLAIATYFCWPAVFASVLLLPACAAGTLVVLKMAREHFTQAMKKA